MDKEPNSQEPPAPPEAGDSESDRPSSEVPPVGFRGPLGEDAVERLRRYQVITLPPDARVAMLGAKLPGASRDLLFDTLPPNRGHELESESTQTSAPPLSLEDEREEAPFESDEPPLPLPTRSRVMRAFMLAFGLTMLGLALLVLFTQPGALSPAAANRGERPGQSEQRPPITIVEPATAAAPAPQQTAPVLASEPPSPPQAPKASDEGHTTTPNVAPRKEHFAAPPPASAGIAPPAPITVHPPAPEGSASKSMRMGSR